jgi:hypothetical protein
VYDGLFVSGIHFIDENLGFGLANYHIVKTTDGGISWTEYNDGNYWILFDIFFVNANVGFACGSGGALLKTTDGGESWIDLTQNFGTFTSVYFVDENNGYMCGDNCSFYQTSNGGHNWISIEYLSCIGFGTIFFTNELTGYIVGEDGRIFKTTNGGLVSAKANVKPKSGYALFPNPANSTITINTAVNTTGLPLNIRILNCNGMQVKTASHTNLPVQIDISYLSPGIYFVRIETANSVETKKMIKM